MIRLWPQRKTSLLSTRREEDNVTFIYIYVQQLYIKEEGKCRIMNQGWIDTDILGINGRDYSPTFGQNNSKKGRRVVVQDKLLGSELCLLVFESKTGEVYDFCFCCMVGK
jgi:hypothetical protein